MKKSHPVVFSDFDGTITQKDVLMSIIEHFAPPIWKDIWKKIFTREITISQGVKELFHLIPASKKDEIVNWVLKNMKIREGFKDFLIFLKERSVPFVVVSGGLDFYIKPLLEPYKEYISSIYSNKAVFSGRYIDVEFIYRCNHVCKNDCGMCKPYIMEKFYKDKRPWIYIGDSITDLEASGISDIIFARDYLAKTLQALKINHYTYENFIDIRQKLVKLI